jgi:AraC family transcriptional regulator
LIKPYLQRLSGSPSWLDGIIVERDLEPASSDAYSGSPKSPKHVIVFRSGEAAKLEWTMNGSRKQALFTEEAAIINPAGLFTCPRWDSEVELLLLAINPDLISRVAEQMGGRPEVELIPRFGFRDELLRQLAFALIGEFEKGGQPDRVYAESLGQAFLTHLLKKYSIAGLGSLRARGGLSRRVLGQVIDYMNGNLSEKLSLQMIAAVAGMSPSHFVALFKQSTGSAPHQYLMMQRIEKAKQLLTSTTLPVAEIAARTGFADQSHLTRVFREHTGMTPLKFRTR